MEKIVYDRHADRYARCALARRNDCSLRIRVLLATDPDDAVRAEVVNNKITELGLAEAIAELEFAKPVDEVGWVVLQALAYKPGLASRTYQRLYNLGHWYVLIGLAHNRSCPKNILRSIAELPVVFEGANKYFIGYDRNEELRRIAQRRLSTPDQ